LGRQAVEVKGKACGNLDKPGADVEQGMIRHHRPGQDKPREQDFRL
jgi:hypothetical protein